MLHFLSTCYDITIKHKINGCCEDKSWTYFDEVEVVFLLGLDGMRNFSCSYLLPEVNPLTDRFPGPLNFYTLFQIFREHRFYLC